MNNEEAKFMLRVYRPRGGDASDPAFAAACQQAERDPQLRAWWAREQALDLTMSDKLASIKPPADLRQSILLGVKASQPRRQWSLPVWLSVAAAIAVILGMTLRKGSPQLSPLAAYAVRDGADHTTHKGLFASLSGLQDALGNPSVRLAALDVDLAKLQAQNCRTVSLAGHDVFEVCFKREGLYYHLYVASIGDFTDKAPSGKPILTAQGKMGLATWNDGKNSYALVSDKGVEAVRGLL